MDDVVNRLARELADAIAAAVADDPQVEACREKARAAGFEMKVTLEAVVGFVNRTTATEKGGAMVKVPTPAKVVPLATRAGHDGERSPVPALAEDCRGRGRRKKKSSKAVRKREEGIRNRQRDDAIYSFFRFPSSLQYPQILSRSSPSGQALPVFPASSARCPAAILPRAAACPFTS